MQLSSIKEILAKLSCFYTDSALIITGGEPSLHPEFKEIVNFASEQFKKVVITTNGSFSAVTREYLHQKLQTNVYLQISLDGTKDMHRKLRKNEKLFDTIIDNLRAMQLNCRHIALSTTVNEINYDNITDLAQFLNGFKFSHWKVSMEQAFNPISNSNLTIEKWNSLIMKLVEVAQFRLSTSKLFDFDIWDKFVDTANTQNAIKNCGYGNYKFYVDTNFNVLPCTCVDIKIGNLLTDTVEKIDTELKNISVVNVADDSVCYACRYKTICNGGCPGYSLKVFGRVGMGDVRCPMVKNKLNTKC